jgi:pilus assembly protein CpaE
MKVCIASNDSSITAALRVCLERLKVDCPSSRIVGHEAIPLLSLGESPLDASAVLFGIQQLSPDELAILKQLCSGDKSPNKVVVVGTNLSSQVILQAIRSGASDCLDIQRNLESELREVLERITVSQNGNRRLGRMFSVIASGGGAGATLVAVSLAADFARRSFTAGLLDLHVRGGDVATFLKCSPRHTLADLVTKTDHFDLTMFGQSLIKHDSGVSLLASPELFSDFRSMRTGSILRVVQFACHTFTHVVIDLEDCNHDEQLRVLGASEQIVHVVRPDFVSVRRARKLHEFLSRSKISRDHIMLVANRMGSPKSLDKQMIEEGLGMLIDHQLPDDPDAVNRSVNLGVPVILACPQARVSQALKQLTDSLTGSQPTSNGASWTRRQLDRLTAALTDG